MNKGNVTILQLPDKNKESGQNVIERLEEILTMARDGNIKNIFIAASTNDNCLLRTWANGSDCFALAGQIEMGKLEFMKNTIENTL